MNGARQNLIKIIPLPLRKKIKKLWSKVTSSPVPQAYGINIGEGSRVLSIRKLNGPQFIYLGKGTVVGNYAWLGAFDEYAGIKYKPRLILGDYVNIGDFVCIT